ncbi:MAG: aldo/keto reductase [Alphaproteobacteria bacterium]|nr:aldo/keto reductase [Alphaproteobacteria bacterium]
MIKFAIGTAQFGQEYGICNQQGRVEGESAQQIVEQALAHDIDMFDTAKLYGESEAVLGDALSDIDAKQAKIITKYYASEQEPDSILKDFENSRNFLSGSDIYGILIHNADILFSDAGKAIWSVLEDLKKEHHIPKIGVSVYTPEDLKKLMERYDLDIVQLPCNLLDQRFLSADIQNLKKEHGLEFHARSLFLQGLLLSELENLPEHFAQNIAPFGKLTEYIKEHEISRLQACLLYAAWTQENEMIDRWVVGVDSAAQLEQIVRAAHDVESLPQPEFQSFAIHDLDIIDPREWNKA